MKPAVTEAGKEQVKNLGVELVIEGLCTRGRCARTDARRASSDGAEGLSSNRHRLWEKRDKLTCRGGSAARVGTSRNGSRRTTQHNCWATRSKPTPTRWELSLANSSGAGLEGTKAEAEKALSLTEEVSKKHEQAVKIVAGLLPRHQCRLHGARCMRTTMPAAKEIAREVLAICQKASADKWRFATEGEANLVLQDEEQALRAIRRRSAVIRAATTREIDTHVRSSRARSAGK